MQNRIKQQIVFSLHFSLLFVFLDDPLEQFLSEVSSIFLDIFYYSTLLDLKYILLHYMSSVEKSIRH